MEFELKRAATQNLFSTLGIIILLSFDTFKWQHYSIISKNDPKIQKFVKVLEIVF